MASTAVRKDIEFSAYERGARRLALGHQEMADILGVDQSTYWRWRSGSSTPRGAIIRSRLTQFAELLELSRRLFDGPNVARTWLREARPAALGGSTTPLEVMRAGRIDRVLSLLQSLAAGA
ncbi:MAG: DUF2384 domain-containing protein [Gemmatimonadaceae bacterium]|jgi:transcriptional regulator with XRE-family HTH domain|nr:DUF2384 domain-containing protein [Gemmatimonadaceae bacterium]